MIRGLAANEERSLRTEVCNEPGFQSTRHSSPRAWMKSPKHGYSHMAAVCGEENHDSDDQETSAFVT